MTPQIRRPYTSEGFHGIDSFVHFGDDFVEILSRIDDSTSALNALTGGHTATPPLDLRDELASIQYALLRMVPRQHDLNQPKLQRICRQGLLLFLATILNGLPSITSSFDLLGANLVSALQDTSYKHKVPQGLRLWLVLIISIIVYDNTSKSWAKKVFASIVLNSFPQRQEDLKAQLKTFFWVERIHGPRLDELWREHLHFS